MFSENIEIIKNAFTRYSGTGSYFALFFVALIYIFIVEKDKNKRMFLLYFSCLVLFVVLNPIFNKLVNSFLNKNVYQRLFWMVPMGVVIAYVGADIIKKTENISKKTIVSILLICTIMFSGKLIYTEENYTKTNNLFKFPDETLAVIDIMSSIDLENKKAMVSTDLVEYVRQKDASIKLAYPRRPQGYDSYDIVQYYNMGDVKNLTDLCKKKKVNIIVYDKSIVLSISPSYFGYESYAQTEKYNIYILDEN